MIATMLFSLSSYSQSDFDKLVKAGEVVLSGFSILKVAKSNPKKESKTIESVCVKNKLTDKITFKILGKDDQDNDVKKELVIQNDGKECLFDLPKGVYTYEILLSNKETYKKGEYKFDDEIVMTIKKDD
jgi:hypothetical protein